jgi:hypothetical protein
MKKKTAALLDNVTKKLFHIEIECTTGKKATMIFQDKDMSVMTYNTIKNAGIFCGQWVKDITVWESDENTFLTP